VVGFGTLINDQHDAALAAQHIIPVDDVLQNRSIAGSMVQMRVVEGAAETASDTVSSGGLGEAEGVEFGGDLGDDGRLGGEDAGGEQREASDGGAGKRVRKGSRDALVDHLVEWELSGHG
jgi:hypothetical protein